MSLSQVILLNSCLSHTIPVLSQGSHSGPTLFSLFVKYLSCCIQNSIILMFADNVKIYQFFDGLTDMHFLQGNLNNLVTWPKINGMPLNLKKCQKLLLSRVSLLTTSYIVNNHILESVP